MAVLGDHLHITLNDLEENLSTFKLGEYIRECEAGFDERVLAVAGKISSNDDIRAVFISGPSGSGKTTFNSKLAGALEKRGIKIGRASCRERV